MSCETSLLKYNTPTGGFERFERHRTPRKVARLGCKRLQQKNSQMEESIWLFVVFDNDDFLAKLANQSDEAVLQNLSFDVR
jgi:hypothetical protein